jgi:hypothetical protein
MRRNQVGDLFEVPKEIAIQIAKANPMLDHLGKLLDPDLPIGLPRIQAAKHFLLDWEDDLLGIASNLVLGFNLDDSSDVTPELLNDIQSKVGQIQESLNTLNSKIDSIAAELQALPNVIKGIVNTAFASQALSHAATQVGQIKDMTLDVPTYNANEPQVASTIQALEQSLNDVWTFSGNGAMGATLTCHATGVWAQVKALLLRDSTQNPSHFGIRDMSFYQSTKQNIQTLISACSKENLSAAGVYASTPHPFKLDDPNTMYWSFDPSARQFVAVNPRDVPFFCDKQVYVTFGAPDPGTTLLGGAFFDLPRNSCIPQDVSRPLPPSGRLRFVDPNNVAAAAAAWPGALAVRQAAEAILEFMANSDQAFNMLDGVFT